jgi:Phage tail sheath protein subtilisin-like domain/Phage tail sheath C-terminal domain
MPFQVSPGVNVSEIDLTTVVPAVSTTEGAFAGMFRWGPVEKRVLVDSEDRLIARFGKPVTENAETFFTAANFLSYGNKLYVVRAAAANAYNAIANTGAIGSPGDFRIKSEDHFQQVTTLTADTDGKFVARYPGALGNSLKVSVCATPNAFSQNVAISLGGDVSSNVALSNVSITPVSSTNTNVRVTVNLAVGNGTIANAVSRAGVVAGLLAVGDVLTVGNSTVGTQDVRVTSISSVSNTATVATFTVDTSSSFGLISNTSASTIARRWEYADIFTRAPGTSTYQAAYGNTSVVDELHVVVADEDGLFTGTRGSVLEAWQGLSRATDAKNDGAVNYYATFLNDNSSYVWYANYLSGVSSNTATNLVSVTNNEAPSTISFTGGTDGTDGSNAYDETTLPLSDVVRAYDMFASAEDVDVSLVLTGKSRGGTNGEYLGNYLIDNIAEKRKDCVVFVSPDKADVVNNSAQDEVDDVIAFRNGMRASSYAVMDSGYKYQYDKYNDVYRWIPLNGDVAGLCVRTDQLRDAWWSPAGFNRGQIKNIVKLAWNPGQAERDQLYKKDINPVVTFPGQGTLLYGDKTLLGKPSAFDRINVRRLFIVLEKAIATAAKYTMFEFNDDFTRAQFRNLVEPFLRDVQGRRGIYDYKVVCDTTNNTGEVIDRNEFIGDIYIKPAKSINFIQLNFVAVRTGVEFSEVVGQF